MTPSASLDLLVVSPSSLDFPILTPVMTIRASLRLPIVVVFPQWSGNAGLIQSTRFIDDGDVVVGEEDEDATLLLASLL